MLELLVKHKKLVGVFHQSTSVNDCLLEKQRTMYQNNKSIIGHQNNELIIGHRLIQVLLHDGIAVAICWYGLLNRVQLLVVARDDKLSKIASNNVKTY